MTEKRDSVKEELENMAEKPAGADKGSECAEEKAGSVKEAQKESPERAGEKPERAEESPERAEGNPERAEESPERAEESPERAEEKSERAEGSPESPEEKPASKEEKSETEGTEEAVADKTDHESKGEKKPGLRKKIIGIAELTAAFLFMALSIWLFINTRGTRLLYVSVTAGRVSRYYWISFVMAAMLMTLGLITLKSCRRKDKKDLPQIEEKAPKDMKADH